VVVFERREHVLRWPRTVLLKAKLGRDLELVAPLLGVARIASLPGKCPASVALASSEISFGVSSNFSY
jgi:shikimate kinase